MTNTDNTPTCFEQNVIALDDFTDSQLKDLRGRLPPSRIGNFCRFWCHFGTTRNILFSGWNLHIPGENIAHSVYLYENLHLVLIKWRASAKVGGESTYPPPVITGYMIPPTNKDFGMSGANIYVPPSVFKDNHLQEFVDDILRATEDYHCEVKPLCTKHLYSHLYYRYELHTKCDITVGIPMGTYSTLSVKSQPGIPYKPDEVIDPFLELMLPPGLSST